MSLLYPLALAALAPLSATIVVLYLLKLRRQRVLVSSVFLWQRAVDDLQANAPFQKLRRNLLLLLQLLALALLVLGLAAPYTLVTRSGGRSSVLVLDASASMQATDVAGSRFEQARRGAMQFVGNARRGDETALVVCGARAAVALPFTTDKRRLQAALKAARPSDCGTNMKDGILLALSLAGKRPGARVYVLSDGAFGQLPAVPASAAVQFVRVGTRSDNVAIVGLETVRSKVHGTHQVFIRIQSFSSEAKPALLSIYHEKDLIEAREITLQPGASVAETYDASLPRPGLIRAELEVRDDLSVDNVAYTFSASDAQTRILLVTPGNLFLEQALLVQPEVEVFKATGLTSSEATAAYEQYDVVVFDRVAPPVGRPSGAMMYVDVDPPAVLGTAGAAAEQPAVTDWDKTHPALEHVNLGAVQIASAKPLSPAAGARVLAHSGEQGIVLGLESPELRALAFGWDFMNSDLPLRIGFPVLLRNALQWLAEGRGGVRRLQVRPGTVLRLSPPADARRATVTYPDGSHRTVAVTEGAVTLADVDRVGEYSMAAGGREWRWVADLRDPAESNLRPADRLRLGDAKIAQASSSPQTEQHLWPLLALVALCILLGEWHLYHRRP